MKRFSEITEEPYLDGKQIKIEKVFDREIVVVDYHVKDKSNYNDDPAAKILFELNGVRYITWTQSIPLMRQLREHKKDMPFVATIRNFNNYFTFT